MVLYEEISGVDVTAEWAGLGVMLSTWICDAEEAAGLECAGFGVALDAWFWVVDVNAAGDGLTSAVLIAGLMGTGVFFAGTWFSFPYSNTKIIFITSVPVV